MGGGTGGGGCGQPSGTKAVINITVPLSALAAFGFTLNNTTEGSDTDEAYGPEANGTDTTDQVGAETAGTAGATAGAAGALAAQIRRLIFDDRTGLPLDLGRAHRLAPGYLRTAAFVGHTTCAWSGGCDVPVPQCEADPISDLARTRPRVRRGVG